MPRLSRNSKEKMRNDNTFHLIPNKKPPALEPYIPKQKEIDLIEKDIGVLSLDDDIHGVGVDEDENNEKGKENGFEKFKNSQMKDVELEKLKEKQLQELKNLEKAGLEELEKLKEDQKLEEDEKLEELEDEEEEIEDEDIEEQDLEEEDKDVGEEFDDGNIDRDILLDWQNELDRARHSRYCSILPVNKKTFNNYRNSYKHFYYYLCNNKLKIPNDIEELQIILLNYFVLYQDLFRAGGTFYTRFSGIKCFLSVIYEIDGGKCFILKKKLKQLAKGTKRKVGKALSTQQRLLFNSKFVGIKYINYSLAMDFASAGLRRSEFGRVIVDGITFLVGKDDKGNDVESLKVNLSRVKNEDDIIFFISDPDAISRYREYIQLSKDARSRYAGNRLFLQVRKYRGSEDFVFHPQPLGYNWFGGYAKFVAKSLGEKDFKLYRTHWARHQNATKVANSGANVLEVKSFGGWKSLSVAEGYVMNCDLTKFNLSRSVVGADRVKSLDVLDENKEGLISKSSNVDRFIEKKDEKNPVKVFGSQLNSGNVGDAKLFQQQRFDFDRISSSSDFGGHDYFSEKESSLSSFDKEFRWKEMELRNRERKLKDMEKDFMNREKEFEMKERELRLEYREKMLNMEERLELLEESNFYYKQKIQEKNELEKKRWVCPNSLLLLCGKLGIPKFISDDVLGSVETYAKFGMNIDNSNFIQVCQDAFSLHLQGSEECGNNNNGEGESFSGKKRSYFDDTDDTEMVNALTGFERLPDKKRRI